MILCHPIIKPVKEKIISSIDSLEKCLQEDVIPELFLNNNLTMIVLEEIRHLIH